MTRFTLSLLQVPCVHVTRKNLLQVGYVEDRKIRVCETNIDYAEPLTVAYEGAVGVYQVPDVIPTWLAYVQFNSRYNTN